MARRRSEMPFDLPSYDEIDETEYDPSADPDDAMARMDYFGESASGQGSPVRGQVVPFVMDAAGILTSQFFQLLRAESKKETYWQLTLAPIFTVPQGPTFASRPALTGNPHCEMRWGGGGVTYRTRFAYPAQGASFLVSGDNIDLSVQAFDGVTVFTPQTLPAVAAWCSPRGNGTVIGAGPLLLDALNYPGLYGPQSIPGFARAMTVAMDTAGATATVLWRIAGVTISSIILNAGQLHRLAIPSTATEVVVTSSAGFVAVGWELAFT